MSYLAPEAFKTPVYIRLTPKSPWVFARVRADDLEGAKALWRRYAGSDPHAMVLADGDGLLPKELRSKADSGATPKNGGRPKKSEGLVYSGGKRRTRPSATVEEMFPN
jgi:hypothetical protein